MKISTNKNLKILTLTGLIFTAAIAVTLGAFAQNTNAYSPYCVTAACRAAADKADAASAAASNAKAEANTLQGELDALDAEISELQAQIAESEAMKSDLQSQIKDTEAELLRDKEAIRTLVVKTSQSDSTSLSAIDILASSESIGDIVEDNNRQESIEEQLTKAANQVKAAKEKLEQQKAAVQASIDRISENKSSISSKRAEQASLKAKYENDAAAYTKDAAAATATMNAEMQKQLNSMKSQAVTRGSVITISSGSYRRTVLQYGQAAGIAKGYRYANSCPQITYNYIVDNYTYYKCQCTSYAAWAASTYAGASVTGYHNAHNWAFYYQKDGSGHWLGRTVTPDGRYRVDNTPAPRTVAVESADGFASGTGHVMWVEQVQNGKIIVSEYNNGMVGHGGDYSLTEIPYETYKAFRFIHFN